MSTVVPLDPEKPSQAVPLAGLNQLLDLAKKRSPDDQHRLLMGVAGLYESAADHGGAPDALADIFVALTRSAEREIRQVLAQRLAKVDWAPAALVRMLAADEIQIARPVIAASPLLLDDDLLQLLTDCSIEHQIQVALRPDLGAAVARAIIAGGDPAVMTALATNRSAQIEGSAFADLVDRSRQLAALRAPLTRHPSLDEDLALRLYQWVGEALRQAISDRFTIDPARLAQTVQDAAQATTRTTAATWDNAPITEDTDARLVAKLHAAGQLRPAYLIRALREEKLGVFAHGLATLGRFEVAQIHRALQGDTARPLFLACIAVGLDRAAFPALLTEIRKLNKGFPRDPDSSAWRLAERSADQAAYEFRLLMADIESASV
ncbi:uncharacterized protein (DUF2336 family) [Brevundimonas bullata]|uniref:Uncharacterized protein (DUF2336 family) n=1 Tax=Brevundimonas bullata TaxID=13160 RepID=A0A7W7IRU5_9CAUL|nr:DUF2336 domain-containing protein [Brevundimonas bullata]MBB4799374.1 uncharacterized protein (DUF2336 family) [Brevundimonas bullata]MBB6384554.1 uncharacterized protein (DUF2336 family) [Brevundimonas bullata]